MIDVTTTCGKCTNPTLPMSLVRGMHARRSSICCSCSTTWPCIARRPERWRWRQSAAKESWWMRLNGFIGIISKRNLAGKIYIILTRKREGGARGGNEDEEIVSAGVTCKSVALLAWSFLYENPKRNYRRKTGTLTFWRQDSNSLSRSSSGTIFSPFHFIGLIYFASVAKLLTTSWGVWA